MDDKQHRWRAPAKRRTPERLAAYHREAGLAREAIDRRDADAAMHHLERAHILGQPWPGAHSWTHWMMLRLGLSVGDWREVLEALTPRLDASLIR